MLRVAPGACGALWSKDSGNMAPGEELLLLLAMKSHFLLFGFGGKGKREKRGKTLTVDSRKTPPQRRSEYDNASVWTCVL